jgi:hypothetical protein
MIIYIDGTNREATEIELSAIRAEQATLTKENAQAEADRTKAKADVLAKLGLTAAEVAALLS